MKQKKLIFNFFVNRNWKKLTDSRKTAKILADNRKGHHPIETLEESIAAWPFTASLQTIFLTARAYSNTQKYGLFCSLTRSAGT